MTHPVRTRAILGAAVAAALLLPVHSAAAQPGTCDRVGTTSIAFGRTAGNIKPAILLLRTNGNLVRIDSARMSQLATVPVTEVQRLARRGWTGPFATLPESPTRPTRNPDMARDFVELRSACGVKHVEYAMGEGPPAFRELYDALAAIAGNAPPPR